MSKSTAFGARPRKVIEVPAQADEFVQGGREEPIAPPAEPENKPAKMKRLTIDIDPALHKRLKRKAADKETTIADVARKLLEQWESE
jgi:hypothetical protein